MDKDTLARLVTFAGRNIVENLNHIPEDKWDWKPGPDAKSAEEIINHVLGLYETFNSAFGGRPFAAVSDIPEAQAAVLQATEDYARHVRAITPEKLAETIEIVPGTVVPLSGVVPMAVIDILHHHGQLAYIQTLLGDNEMYFDRNAFALLT